MGSRPGRNACSGTARFDLILVSRLLCFHVNRFGNQFTPLAASGQVLCKVASFVTITVGRPQVSDAGK
ncbi:MAG: hypothetical protein CMJ20_11100 [Phycisphaeraceae bacterium]|nr:hypothetical protein [Phycisphaeraceae bacterium]